MKRFRKLYFLLLLCCLLTAILLIYCLSPAGSYPATALAALIPLAILAIGSYWINRQQIRLVRLQLYQILRTLEEFDIDEPKKVAFKVSSFTVFNELNDYLIELINRIRSDFHANKQFTQNASHELQTPLAVIKGQVELLLQSPNIGERESESLAVVLQNTNRLSKLNSALILLSKIEHHRFLDAEMVDFARLTDEVLLNFEDLIEIQGLEIRRNYQERFEVDMSGTLAEILIANLVQNAIRHNRKKGFIAVKINSNHFSISNPGKKPGSKPEMLFKRFKRESNAEESLGLGLSIVRKICEQPGLEVSYTYEQGIHTLKVVKKH